MFPMIRAALLGLTVAAASAAPPSPVRFASYNVSFFRAAPGDLIQELGTPEGTSANHGDIRQVAEALQRINPDVLLLNEFDYDPAGDAMRLFHDHFLAVPQKAGLNALNYPWRYSAPSNTGISTGLDLDNNGTAVTTPGTEAYGNDCFGFGTFPGQYGMVIYSKFPLVPDKIRRFQLFKWKDMPGSQLLLASGSPPLTTYYSAAERDLLRLSSKTHLDIPVDLGGGILVHILASHPTPPTFDGSENKNGKRNFDEIRFWADYIDPARSAYLYDDAGMAGGLPAGARFVIKGDQNADPNDGDTLAGAARQLTQHPLINASFIPSSGAVGATALPGASGGGVSFPGGAGQTGNKLHDTAAFSGGLRVDYVLPSRAGFSIFNGAVFWPGPADPLRAVVSDSDPSDHHMVWMDLRPQISLAEAVINLTPSWTGTALQLNWQASAGYAYRIRQSASMNAATWDDSGITPVIAPGTLAASAVLPATVPGRMFYRVEVTFAP